MKQNERRGDQEEPADEHMLIKVNRAAFERARRENPRLRRETDEHIRRLRRLVAGLPRDW